VEWAHAIAPGANITLVLAKTNDDADILSATQYAVDHNLGNVISQSFGENESCVDSNLLAAQRNLFVKATLKHITLIASSGDDGAAQGTCDGSSIVLAASSPASDPLVTAVGGTALHAADFSTSAAIQPRILLPEPTRAKSPGTKATLASVRLAAALASYIEHRCTNLEVFPLIESKGAYLTCRTTRPY
jgi:subtilase family serine protease